MSSRLRLRELEVSSILSSLRRIPWPFFELDRCRYGKLREVTKDDYQVVVSFL